MAGMTCVGIRATPIAEAMLALVLMDHALRHRAQNADVVCTTPKISGTWPISRLIPQPNLRMNFFALHFQIIPERRFISWGRNSYQEALR